MTPAQECMFHQLQSRRFSADKFAFALMIADSEFAQRFYHPAIVQECKLIKKQHDHGEIRLPWKVSA
jgi:hypothetical protein